MRAKITEKLGENWEDSHTYAEAKRYVDSGCPADDPPAARRSRPQAKEPVSQRAPARRQQKSRLW
jgi:hypothetical protein